MLVPPRSSRGHPRLPRQASRIGDGYVNVGPKPEPLQKYREEGGKGPAIAAMKVCWGEDERAAHKLAFDVWKTTGVPGELNQELSLPRHFEQAAQLVSEETVTEAIACGPDPEAHAQLLRNYFEAGYETVYVSQIGDDQAGFLEFFFKKVRPRLSL
ncbi:MAG: hypothetical protein ACRDZX_15620 [Acidimicrobiales bacterium]